jgi:hypothetical protein
VLTLTGFCRGGRPLLFRLGILLLAWDCPGRWLVLYQKDFGWMALLGVEPRNVCAASAEGLRDLEGGPRPLWSIPWHFLYSWGKARRTSVSVADLPQDYWLRPLGCLLRDSLGWPAEHQFTSVTRGTSVSPRSAQVLSPHQLTSSRNFQWTLWCGRRGTESPNLREFTCYQRTKLRYSQCGDTWIVRPEAFGHGCGQRTSRWDA